MKLLYADLPCPGVQVQAGPGMARLRVSGHELILKNQHIQFQPSPQGLRLGYRSSYRGKARGVLGTWQSTIARLIQGKTWTYRVTAIFKHFPISMVVEPGRVRVLNYYGIKNPAGQPGQLCVETDSRVMVQSLDPRTLTISSRDRVLAGNVAARFYNLRYRVHARNMDRRRFTDGFLMELI